MENKKLKKSLLFIIACVLAITICFCKISGKDEMASTIGEIQNVVIDELQTIDKDILIEDITENEESSNENTIEEVTIEDEQELEEEDVIEVESFELQSDEISYDGNGERFGLTVTGNPQLTYISQIDLRWKDYSYTSTNNKTQTIGSSGCGVACSTMVIDAIVGQVDIRDVADTFVKCGYRSANNGTYWSAYRAVADEFNIGYTETSDIQKALELLKNNNYVICSVGNGLFTTGGHYIVLVGIEGNTLKIYDPYLYNGKFETSTRKGKVVVSGNTVYCSVENFKAYANYKGFFCYQNVEHNMSKYLAGQKVLVNVPIGIACYQGDYALVDDGDTQFWIHKSVITADNRIYALAEIAFDGGDIDIVQIFSEQFWCNEKYMSIPVETINLDNSVKYSLGNYISISNLNVRSGAGTNYKIKKTYKKGTVFTAIEIKNNWARTPSGWVCLDYAKKQ